MPCTVWGMVKALRSRWLRRLGWFIGTGFGAGICPIGPGTAGSAAALVIYYLICLALTTHPSADLYLLDGLQLREVLPSALLIGLIVVGFPVGVWATGTMSTAAEPDPGRAVWDEFVGMWVTCLLLPKDWLWLGAAFLVFRALDVVKPWPARRLERLPGGLGIMADDLMVGIYGTVVLNGVRLVFLD